MWIALPKELVYRNTSISNLQEGINEIYTQVHDALDSLCIDDPDIIRNSQLLTLSFLLWKELPSLWSGKSQILNDLIILSKEHWDFWEDEISDLQELVNKNKQLWITLDGDKLEVRELWDKKFFKKFVLHKILEKYYRSTSN